MDKKEIKIASTSSKDFSIKIDLSGETYLIDSEDLGIENPNIITRVYQKGKIIYSNKINYKDLLNEPDFDKRLNDLIHRQQNIAVQALKDEEILQERTHKDDIKEVENSVIQKKTYKDYVKEVEVLILSDNHQQALELLTEAMERYPHNAVILSYGGYFRTFMNKQYSEGLKICRQSFQVLKEQMPLVESFFLPILYLNLGRAYLAANKKKEAYFAFQKGLDIDKKNENILRELKKLGIRRKPFFPFLKRSNPLNKYIGILTYKMQKQKFHR